MDLSPLIIGVPVAGWAVFSALLLVGVSAVPAGIAGVAWGLAWLLVARFVRPLRRRSRNGRVMRREAAPLRQRFYRGALAVTAMYPAPVYLVTFIFVSTHLMAAPMALGVVSGFGLIVPALLWWYTLRPERHSDSGPFLTVELPRTESMRPSSRGTAVR